MGAGTLSAILGVLYALTQNDIKRLLAYSTIEHSGIILLGLGTGMVSGAGPRRTGRAGGRGQSRARPESCGVQGAAVPWRGKHGDRHRHPPARAVRRSPRVMPWTGLCFLVGAIAISGLPLLNGFVSEWLMFQALLLGFESTTGLMRLNFPLGGCDAGVDDGAGRGVFRQGIRDRLSGVAQEPGSGRGARITALDARAPGAFWRPCASRAVFSRESSSARSRSVTGSLPGVRPRPEMVRSAFGIASAPESFDRAGAGRSWHRDAARSGSRVAGDERRTGQSGASRHGDVAAS